MKKGGVGGANTRTGLVFERNTDLRTALGQIDGITFYGTSVFRRGQLVGRLLQKHDLYSFLEERRVPWQRLISKKLLPDEAYFSIAEQTLIVVEKKFQTVAGSVDEKLQTCHFKKRQYEKLCGPIDVKVEYVYVLNDWFKHPSYQDVLSYINDVGCRYHYSEIPIDILGLDK
jgi:hypothetical protein